MKADPIEITQEDSQDNQNWRRLVAVIDNQLESEAFLASHFGRLFVMNLQKIEANTREQKKKIMLSRLKRMFFDKHLFDMSRQYYCVKREPQYNIPNCSSVNNQLLIYGTDFWPTRSISLEAQQINIKLTALKIDNSHTKLVFINHQSLLQWLSHYESKKKWQSKQQQDENMEDEGQMYRNWFPLRNYRYQGYERRRQARLCTSMQNDINVMIKDTKYTIFQLVMQQAQEKLFKNSAVPQIKEPITRNRVQNREYPRGQFRKMPYSQRASRHMSRSRDKLHFAKNQQSKRSRSKSKLIDANDLSNLDNLNQSRMEFNLELESEVHSIDKMTEQFQRFDIMQNNAINEGNMSIQVNQKNKQQQPDKMELEEGELNLSLLQPKQTTNKRKTKGEDLNLSIFNVQDDYENSAQIQQYFPLKSKVQENVHENKQKIQKHQNNQKSRKSDKKQKKQKKQTNEKKQKKQKKRNKQKRQKKQKHEKRERRVQRSRFVSRSRSRSSSLSCSPLSRRNSNSSKKTRKRSQTKSKSSINQQSNRAPLFNYEAYLNEIEKQQQHQEGSKRNESQ